MLQPPPGPSRRCCKCNRTAKCVRCACVRSGKPCSCCLPGDRTHSPRSRRSSPAPPVTPAVTHDPPSFPTSTSAHPSPAPVGIDGPLPAAGPTPLISASSSPPTVRQHTPTAADALPTLDMILRLRIPTLSHVPKAARASWSTLVGDVLSTIVSNPSLEGPWRRLFMLAKCILANPPRGGRSHWRDTLKLLQARIQRWKEGDLLGLWVEPSSSIKGLRSRSARSKSKPTSSESLRRSNATRARRAVEDGQYKKALQSLTSMGLAPPSSDVFDEMLAKHPQSDPPPLSGMAPSPSFHVSPEEVVSALKSFPTGSAPGPSGLRANHLKEAVFCSSPHHAHLTLQSLTSFVNLLCAGKAPQVIVPHLCGASLLPCKKKDGGLRPIAVGEVLRRLSSKCATRAVLPDALSILSPLQVGVGLPGRCDAVLHSVMSVLHDTNIPSNNKFTLLVDFSNAFNSINRAAMFKEVRSRLPKITSWMECSYGSQPILLLDDRPIHNCCGVQPYCPN